MRMSIVLGLTGSFGSGKSTVARMFAEMGVPVIDADQVAREVVEPGTSGLAKIVEAFGSGVLDAEGRLDRKRMADLIFQDEEARRKLNGIVHPRVGQELARFVMEHAGEPVIVLEIPLLLEGGRKAPVNKVVVVTANDEARLARLRAAGFTPAEVEARLRAQMPQEEKVKLADHVIRNDGGLEATRRQVRELSAQYGVAGFRQEA
jgi:dephospho-CoA kinase